MRENLTRRKLVAALGAGMTGSLVGYRAVDSATADILRGRAPTQTQGESAPPTETSSEIDTIRNVMVEMRDGVKLATDVYKPKGGKEFPTLVMRTPYDKNEEAPIMGLERTVKQGFAVVIQDCRGRFASEGDADWEPVFEEGPDGYDTIEWAADQPWSSGNVGMVGKSYLGMTTFLAALEDPPSLKAILPQMPSWYDYDQLGYQYGGILELGNTLSWLALNSFDTISRLDVTDERKQELEQGLNELIENITEQGYEQLPLTDIEAINAISPSWKRYLEHYTKDQYWNRVSVPKRVDQLSVPVLHVGGWYDAFVAGHYDVFRAIEEEADDFVRENHHMIMGPWTHLNYPGDSTSIGEHDFGPGSSPNAVVADLALDWFEHWLTPKTRPNVESLPKVKYFQMGKNEWQTGTEWSPSASDVDFYLDSNGKANVGIDNGLLTTDMPLGDSPADEYTYDPEDPVPTRGGTSVPLQADSPGISDQSDIEQRDDVLVYSTPVLNRDISIAGPIELTLFIESDAPDTDFTAKLVDVGPDGYAANITEGGLRTRFRNSLTDPELMEPGSIYELSIKIRHTAHTFQKGHRIRLDVTSSNFPRFDRNPNNGTIPAKATSEDMTIAEQRVYHDEHRPSRVTLPVTDP